MLIKSLHLHNIRSYRDARLEFPEGLLLLSGDIGSGKSTILLAVEFALFGLLRGTSSGKDLLRHGCQQGFVDLTIEIDGIETTIRRGLKSQNGTVTQVAGWIEQGGARKDLTASEMKSYVLRLLGYPQSLLMRGKGLMYRYTLYTPQEAMKLILQEDAELRLDTLRKIFNIDKYKTVKKNASFYAKGLSQEMRLMAERIKDLPVLEGQYKQHVESSATLESNVGLDQEKHSQVQQKLARAKLEFSAIEEKRTEVQRLKSQLNECVHKKTFSEQRLAKLESERKVVEQSIEVLRKELSAPVPHVPDTQQLFQNVRELQNALAAQSRDYGTWSAQREQQQAIIKRLSNLDSCPVCLQSVDADHKHAMTDAAMGELTKLSQKFEELDRQGAEKKLKLAELQKQIDICSQLQQQIMIRSRKEAMVEERTRRNHAIEQEMHALKEEIAMVTESERALNERISLMPSLETEYATSKKVFEEVQALERQCAIRLATLQEQIRSARVVEATLKTSIDERKASRDKMKATTKIRDWMMDVFLPLMDQIEIHVFSSIHRHFGELFANWCAALLDEDQFTVRLDESFSPIIQINGYDTEYAQLSGGERTAVALAYRLALNSVVNHLISTMKTNDLLILDEPTEGFSSAQLEKVRDVLTNLGLRQIIIVSHEHKIETFVDHVIKISKEGNESMVNAGAITSFS